MDESKMMELAQQLLDSARTGKLAWEEGTSRYSYIVNFQDIALVIVERSVGVHHLELINGDGDGIESLRPKNIATEEILQEIYDIARRQALDIDGNINKALEYLKRG